MTKLYSQYNFLLSTGIGVSVQVNRFNSTIYVKSLLIKKTRKYLHVLIILLWLMTTYVCTYTCKSDLAKDIPQRTTDNHIITTVITRNYCLWKEQIVQHNVLIHYCNLTC